MENEVNNGAMLISAVFGTRDHFDSPKVFLSKSF